MPDETRTMKRIAWAPPGSDPVITAVLAPLGARLDWLDYLELLAQRVDQMISRAGSKRAFHAIQTFMPDISLSMSLPTRLWVEAIMEEDKLVATRLKQTIPAILPWPLQVTHENREAKRILKNVGIKRWLDNVVPRSISLAYPKNSPGWWRTFAGSEPRDAKETSPPTFEEIEKVVDEAIEDLFKSDKPSADSSSTSLPNGDAAESKIPPGRLADISKQLDNLFPTARNGSTPADETKRRADRGADPNSLPDVQPTLSKAGPTSGTKYRPVRSTSTKT